jgi:hypothetical protein
MKIVWEGELDLKTRQVELIVLLAPLKTLDKIVNNVPLVGKVLGGSLISIPVKVEGPVKDPRVTPLSASALGSGLLNTMKRTLGIPFEVFEFVFPK